VRPQAARALRRLLLLLLLVVVAAAWQHSQHAH
jgi:hypothetical protein